MLARKWIVLPHQPSVDDKFARFVKMIIGNRETLRRYSIETGELQSERTVEFRLSQSGPVRVFSFRPIGGEAPIDEERIDELLEQVLDRRLSAQLDEDLDIDFAFGWQKVARIRGNAYYQRSMPALALRIIPDRIPTFDEIGLPPSVQRLAGLQQGLVLFTGPTGAGKSTSLASIVEWINAHRQCHVITIEDPIEYVHTHKASIVSQREVGLDTSSFSRALHAALREDPDVVLVGEMRDPESIAITLTLAETGHLVFSTLHTNDASQALDRIVDAFPTERQGQIRMQLANVLTAVVAQRLVPMAKGGLTAAFEVLMGTSAVKNLILEGKTHLTAISSNGAPPLYIDAISRFIDAYDK